MSSEANANQTDDLESAFDDLEVEAGEVEAPAEQSDDRGVELSLDEDEGGAESASNDDAPPPLPPRGPDGRGVRGAFEDLFVPSGGPLPAPRGGLEEKVAYFREKLKRAEELQSRFRQAWETRERELNDLEKRVEVEANKAEIAERKLAESDEVARTLRAELEQTGNRLEQEQEQFSTERNRLETLLANAKGEWAGERTALLDEVENLSRKTQEKEALLEDQDAQIKNLKDQNEGLAARHDEVLKERQQDIENHQEALRELRRENETTIDDLTQQVESLTHEVGIKDEAITQLKTAVQNERTAIEGRDQRIEELQGEAEAAREQLSSLGQELEESSQQTVALTSERDGLLGKVEELEGDIANLKSEITGFKDTLSSAYSENAKLERAAKDKQIELDELNTKMTDLIENQEIMEQEHKAETESRDEAIARLKESLSQQHEVISGWQTQAQEKEAALKETRAQLEALREKYQGGFQRLEEKLRAARRLVEESLVEDRSGIALD